MNVQPRTSWGAMALLVLALAVAGCEGDDGTDGIDGADGTAGPSGANFHGNGETGLADDRILPYDVQAAYNDDTFFWRVSYRGNEGKRHEYIRYTNGAWQREGGDRRDAQATLDGDAQQGDQSVNSIIYEQRTTIMVNDPNAIIDVTNFGASWVEDSMLHDLCGTLQISAEKVILTGGNESGMENSNDRSRCIRQQSDSALADRTTQDLHRCFLCLSRFWQDSSRQFLRRRGRISERTG